MKVFKRPKFILFDFGGTLFDDGVYDNINGFETLRLAATNPEVTTADKINELWTELITDTDASTGSARGYGIETPLSAILRNILTRAGLKYDVPMVELEYLFDRDNSPRELTPGIENMLDACVALNIPTAVISNITMSGPSLARAVTDGLPKYKMEFVLTSADYLLCKPSGDMFEAAANIYDIDPSDCWYCGNDGHCDVYGALNGGMFPVFYNRNSKEAIKTEISKTGQEFLVINDWAPLVSLLLGNTGDFALK